MTRGSIAVGHRQHRDDAWHLRRDRGTRRCKAALAREIGLGQQHDVGAADLVLEYFGQWRLVIEIFGGRALGLDGGGIGREAAGRDGFRIGKGNHAVDRDPRPDLGPVERLQKRLWQRQAGGFDQDVVGPHRP